MQRNCSQNQFTYKSKNFLQIHKYSCTHAFLVIRLLTDGSILPSTNILQAMDFYRASFITGHTAPILTYLTDFKNIYLIELKCHATNVFWTGNKECRGQLQYGIEFQVGRL